MTFIPMYHVYIEIKVYRLGIRQTMLLWSAIRGEIYTSHFHRLIVTVISVSPSLICYVDISGPILGMRAANERRRYFVTKYLVGWVQSPIYFSTENNGHCSSMLWSHYEADHLATGSL